MAILQAREREKRIRPGQISKHLWECVVELMIVGCRQDNPGGASDSDAELSGVRVEGGSETADAQAPSATNSKYPAAEELTLIPASHSDTQ